MSDRIVATFTAADGTPAASYTPEVGPPFSLGGGTCTIQGNALSFSGSGANLVVNNATITSYTSVFNIVFQAGGKFVAGFFARYTAPDKGLVFFMRCDDGVNCGFQTVLVNGTNNTTGSLSLADLHNTTQSVTLTLTSAGGTLAYSGGSISITSGFNATESTFALYGQIDVGGFAAPFGDFVLSDLDLLPTPSATGTLTTSNLILFGYTANGSTVVANSTASSVAGNFTYGTDINTIVIGNSTVGGTGSITLTDPVPPGVAGSLVLSLQNSNGSYTGTLTISNANPTPFDITDNVTFLATGPNSATITENFTGSDMEPWLAVPGVTIQVYNDGDPTDLDDLEDGDNLTAKVQNGTSSTDTVMGITDAWPFDTFFAGVLSAVSHTVSTVVNAWTAATGGTGSIDAQMQWSADGLTGWADVSGAVASPGTHAGLIATTTYYYRVAYADDITVIYSNVVAVTTAAVVSPTAQNAGQTGQESVPQYGPTLLRRRNRRLIAQRYKKGMLDGILDN